MALPPRKAMVLAAGLGTRLRPLTEAVPKPAVPLCGVPPILFNLAILAASGVEEVVINTHWRPDAIRAATTDASRLGLRLHFSHEPKILGTGGGLAKVREHFADETFYVLNGKVLFDVDLKAAFDAHRELGSVATMVLRPYPDEGAYGAVMIDESRRIRAFRSPEQVSATPAGDLLTPCLFTGLHVLEPRIFDYLPADGASCIKNDGYIPMLGAGEVLCGHLAPEGYWAEPSTPERYLATVLDLIGGRVDLTRFRLAGLDPFAECVEPRPTVMVHREAHVEAGAQLLPPCWIGPAVRIEAGARVGPGAAVESGAIIGAGAKVSETVVWSGTRIGAGEDLRGVIAVESDRISARRYPGD